jgi:pyrroloquinoline quinone biosynthesis protein B
LTYQSISTSASGSEKDSVAFVFEDGLTSQRLLIASDVAAVSDELALLMNTVNMVIWDGTFWREDELSHIVPGKRSASAMGHLALSQERALVEVAGIVVAEDGMIFEL